MPSDEEEIPLTDSEDDSDEDEADYKPLDVVSDIKVTQPRGCAQASSHPTGGGSEVKSTTQDTGSGSMATPPPHVLTRLVSLHQRPGCMTSQSSHPERITPTCIPSGAYPILSSQPLWILHGG